MPATRWQDGGKGGRGRRTRSLIGGALLALLGIGCLALPEAAGSGGRPGRVAGARLSVDSTAYRSAREALPDRFLDHETKRFVVISDAEPRFLREQGQLLERTYHQFRRFTRRLTVRPRPLRHKLVCIFFERHEDYRKFARKHDGVTAEWISGYYSPKHDRVVFYNIETNPALTDAGVSEGRHDEAAVLAARRSIDQQLRRAAIATNIHEAIHQLAFHTGLQSPLIQNPLWISEGLATAFETHEPNEAFGPNRDYEPRREQFAEILRDGKLIPLRKLLTYTDMPDDREETITTVYHQSYALVSWMSRFRKDELRDYLDALRNERPGRPTARRHLDLFEQAFGEVDRLEHKWLRFERDRG